jgi:GNAT superfamily N-acetyltransferase
MIEYRKATINDMEDLLAVRVDFLRLANIIKNENDEKMLLLSNRNFLSCSLIDGSFIQYLAVDSSKIIATSSVSFYLLPPHSMRPNGKVAYIGNMFTYPEYRGQGIGTKLLTLSVESAKEAGCKEVCLDATDMGKTLYENFGFKKNEDAMSYYIV